MSKFICKSSIFPVNANVIWEKLQSLESLQYVAAPFAAFKLIDGEKNIQWECGKTFRLNFKLFGVIPFGIHSIYICTLDKETLTIYSNENNPHVPIWNHRIQLEPIDDNRTKYTDCIEIESGWKTGIIYIWAKAFYAHRQRKWKKLLTKFKNTEL
ncbi:hypothetical protein [Treponema putidum]|uniref:hypothetical protein n=1 Tax=Treponema putidum TaxID=221027 RepID=UPI002105A38C|nr:hypothetical protein [Treponema putidum]UTY31983.1 hypothetical protein E4N75_11225 [Treponema putidum]